MPTDETPTERLTELAALDAAPSRDAAARMLAAYSRSDLAALAEAWGIAYLARDSKAELRRRIVERTPGQRLTQEAYRAAYADPAPNAWPTVRRRRID